MSAPLLQLIGLEKAYGGVRALKAVDLSVGQGEIVGLIGENGAGKSTLIKLVSGVHVPDGGAICWKGQEVQFDSPRAALELGIATIHQELAYFGRLTVAENVMIEEQWPRHWWGGVNWPALHSEASRRLRRFDLNCSTEWAFDQLSAAQKQEVAIVRALCREARLLILDEPTASLTEREVDRLFSHLRRLRAEGISMIYVSHRLDEILELTDRVVVLRDGAMVASWATEEVDIDSMVKAMVGRPLDQVYPHARSKQVGAPLLELKRATKEGMFQDIELTLRAGEVVGLAGLVGAGRSELGRAIYGLYPLDGGEMRLLGKEWKPAGAQDSVAKGLVYLPEERKRQGLVLDHSVRESVSIGFTDLIARFGLIQARAEKCRVQQAVEQFSVRTTDLEQSVGQLSGGNQQKTILARWLDRDPSVIILDEPTRGVDVGAKAEIHALIDRLAGQGKAVLLISSDLPEVLGMSDRVLVLHEGQIAAELSGAEMTQENVMRAASGLRNSIDRSSSGAPDNRIP